MFITNQTFNSAKYIQSVKSVNPIVMALLVLLILVAIPVIIVLFIAFSILSSVIKIIRSFFVKPVGNTKAPNIVIKNVTDQNTHHANYDAEYVDYEIIED